MRNGEFREKSATEFQNFVRARPVTERGNATNNSREETMYSYNAITRRPGASLARAQCSVACLETEMDALAGSTLSILEDGGGLPLVLDRLDEDDALCAALACTTLRDVLLFAQPRNAVRAVGKPYAGKRIVTSVVGVASSAGQLAWVCGLGGAAPSWVRAWVTPGIRDPNPGFGSLQASAS